MPDEKISEPATLRATCWRQIDRRFVAKSYRFVMNGYERYMGPKRSSLLSSASGVVLEIGPGTGVNLQYLCSAEVWIGIEPNRFMWNQLQSSARESSLSQYQLLEANAEQLPFEDASVDSVVSTLVLCSVSSPRAALAEIYRVLRPGGRFYFLEHVVAQQRGWRRALQMACRLPWRLVADQCCTDRDTLATIRATPFSTVDAESWIVPFPRTLPILGPHILGIATK